MTQDRHCPSCHTPMAGRYCARCGERALDPDDFRLRHFVAEAFRIVTEADSRVFRSFRALIARPGLLTAEYMHGRRRPYLLPLQLFLIANIIYFLVQPLTGIDTLSSPLRNHVDALPHREVAQVMVARALEARDMAPEEYAIRFDAIIQGQARTMVLIMVPLFLPFLALAFAFARRRPRVIQHLVFATHYHAFLLLLLMASGPVVWGAWLLSRRLGAEPSWQLMDAGISLILAVLILVYFTVALRRAYGVGWAGAAIRGLVLVGAQVAVIQLYRFILFFTTYYSV